MAWTRDEMAARAAKELKDGFYVNLGIGIPTLVSNFIPAGHERRAAERERHARHGPVPVRGRGGPRPDQRRQADRHAAADDELLLSADSFAMIRGGHIDLAILGAMQVSRDRRPRQLDDPRQDGQGHGRRDGPRRRRQEDRRGDGAHRPRTAAEAPAPLHAAADRGQVVDLVITDLGVFTIDKHGYRGMALIETRARRDARRDRRQDGGDLPYRSRLSASQALSPPSREDRQRPLAPPVHLVSGYAARYFFTSGQAESASLPNASSPLHRLDELVVVPRRPSIRTASSPP